MQPSGDRYEDTALSVLPLGLFSPEDAVPVTVPRPAPTMSHMDGPLESSEPEADRFQTLLCLIQQERQRELQVLRTAMEDEIVLLRREIVELRRPKSTERKSEIPIDVQSIDFSVSSPNAGCDTESEELAQALLVKGDESVDVPDAGRISTSQEDAGKRQGTGTSMRECAGDDAELTGHRFLPLPVWLKQSKEAASSGAELPRVGNKGLPSSATKMLRIQSGEGSLCLEGHDPDSLTKIALNALDGPGRGMCDIMRRFVLLPQSMTCSVIDMFFLVLIFYDLVMIPLMVYSMQETPLTITMSWTARIAWTSNVPKNFFTGYTRKDGLVETRPIKIATRYVRGMLILDLLIILADWSDIIFVGLSEEAYNEGMTRGAGRARLLARVRFLRVFSRLLRLGRLKFYLEQVSDYFFTQRNVLYVDILKISCIFVFVAHWLSCGWYGVGVYSNPESQPDGSWVTIHLGEQPSFEDGYSMSLHWAVSQFVGEPEVSPTNMAERIFVIVSLIHIFVASAVFVSHITASMTRLQMLDGQRSVKLASLRQFLSDRKVSRDLSNRVVRSAEHALEMRQSNVAENDVELLALVSETIKTEIHEEIYGDTLVAHPFFFHYRELDRVGMQQLCHVAISMVNACAGDVVFGTGDRPDDPRMFFVTGGILLYEKEEPERIGIDVGRGTCISEQVLWVPWVHLGTLRGAMNCNLIAVSSDEFCKRMARGIGWQYGVAYATKFVHKLNEALQGGSRACFDDINTPIVDAASVADQVNAREGRRLWRRRQNTRRLERRGTASEALGLGGGGSLVPLSEDRYILSTGPGALDLVPFAVKPDQPGVAAASVQGVTPAVAAPVPQLAASASGAAAPPVPARASVVSAGGPGAGNSSVAVERLSDASVRTAPPSKAVQERDDGGGGGCGDFSSEQVTSKDCVM